MALSQSTLKDLLENLPPADDSVSGALAIAGAFTTYFKAASPAPLAGPIDSIARPAMASAMAFADGSSPIQGATVIVAGLSAFWAAMVSANTTFYPSSTVIFAPLFPLTAASLAAKFALNIAAGTEAAEAADNIAQVLHSATTSLGSVGYFATTPIPIV